MKTINEELDILKHLSVEILTCTELICKAIEAEDLEKIAKELDQRERAIKVLTILLEKFPTDYISKEYPDFERILNRVSILDSEITLNLRKLKDQTHLEIAKTFKTKENLSGYNLNNIK